MKDNKQSSSKQQWMILGVLIAIVVGLNITYPTQGWTAVVTGRSYLWQMLSFIPPVFIISALLDVWVPRHIVERNVGHNSGAKGMAITVLVAASTAGPLYVAFPLAYTLYKKGARLANVVLFLNTWATIKLPMVLNEIKFVGFDFALTRFVVTLPVIVIVSLVVEKMLGRQEVVAGNVLD